MNINASIFKKISGLSGKNHWLDAFGWAGAELVLVAMLGWYCVTAFLAYENDWTARGRAMLVLLIAGLAGWALNFLIAFIVQEPRPFLNQSQDHSLFHPLFPALFTWKSFPSDHALWAMTIFLTALILHLPLAWPLVVLVVWVGWGRVFSGVHYPGDIFGGWAVAVFIASIVNWIINIR